MNQTNKLIVICVECPKQSQTDEIYIRETLNKYYNTGNEVAIRYCEMGTKTKYNQIQSKIKAFTKNVSNYAVIMCVDTDDVFSSPEAVSLNQKISSFCQINGYDLVWFCRDIEEVFLHKQVCKSDKIKEAIRFKTTPANNKATKSLLSEPNPSHRYKSNLLIVFDKYFQHK